MSKVRLGIIGYGNMGSGHYNNILNGRCPEITVTAIADTDPERLKAVKDSFIDNTPEWVKIDLAAERPTCFNTAEEMMDSGLIDAILICVPHYDHPKYAMEGFKRGLHVMVEKPAGVYTKQVREMNEAAEKAGVVFGMMFNQRTNYVYRAMRDLIKSGKYGQIRRTNWLITNWYRPQAYYNSGGWRATWAGEGGGVLLNQSPHQLDLFQWICGMPVKVDAKMSFGKWHDIEVEDDVTAFVEYENGATGAFITSTGDGCGTNRFEVQMDGAKLVVEDEVLRVWELTPHEPEFSRTNTVPFNSPKATELELHLTPDNPQHVGVLNAFAGAILRGEELIAHGSEGINGLSLSNAMHLSAWLGHPVELPVDEDVYYEELMKRVATSKAKENVSAVVSDLSDTYGSKVK